MSYMTFSLVATQLLKNNQCGSMMNIMNHIKLYRCKWQLQRSNRDRKASFAYVWLPLMWTDSIQGNNRQLSSLYNMERGLIRGSSRACWLVGWRRGPECWWSELNSHKSLEVHYDVSIERQTWGLKCHLQVSMFIEGSLHFTSLMYEFT